MISGDGIYSKYQVIIAGRRAELYADPNMDRAAISDSLVEFITEVRSCTHPEFDQWFELYKDTISSLDVLPRKRKRFEE